MSRKLTLPNDWEKTVGQWVKEARLTIHDIIVVTDKGEYRVTALTNSDVFVDTLKGPRVILFNLDTSCAIYYL